MADFINKTFKSNELDGEKLLAEIIQQSKIFWGKNLGDDSSLLLAKNRRGITVNLMSGTPLKKESA